MSLENNNLDFNVLSERITAQTEAYEKFAQSLAKILDLLNELKEKVKNQGDDAAVAFRDLVKTITIISTQLESYVAFTRDSDALMVQNLADYNMVSQQLLVEIRRHQENVAELNETLSEILNSENVRFAELTTTLSKLSTNIESIHNVLQTVAKQTEDMSNSKTNIADKIKGAKYYIFAFLTLIAIIESLIQFGILNIIWGCK